MAKLNLTKLIAQKNALEKQIADAQKAHRGDAIAKVKAMMAEFGVTMADLGGGSVGNGSSNGNGNSNGAAAAPAPAAGNAKSAAAKGKRAGPTAGKKVAAKYRNAATGETWSGRGLKPKWLAAALASGREIAEFTI